MSLYAQLNAIRNEKAEKRRAQQTRRRAVWYHSASGVLAFSLRITN